MAIYHLSVAMVAHMRFHLPTIFYQWICAKSGGEIVNTLRPVTLLDGISGEIWQECLELAEQFYFS